MNLKRIFKYNLIAFILLFIFCNELFSLETDENSSDVSFDEAISQENEEDDTQSYLRVGLISFYDQFTYKVSGNFYSGDIEDLSGERQISYSNQGFAVGIFAEYLFARLPLFIRLDSALPVVNIMSTTRDDGYLIRRTTLDGAVYLINLSFGYYYDFPDYIKELLFERILIETGLGISVVQTDYEKFTDAIVLFGMGIEFNLFDFLFVVPECRFGINITPGTNHNDYESEAMDMSSRLGTAVSGFGYFGYSIYSGLRIGVNF